MATIAVSADPTFVGTNVLIYAAITAAPRHGAAVVKLAALAPGAELWVSRQVLREYLAALSRPQPSTPALPAATLIGDI
jgi:predicted nucleic acid-binding protein